MSDPGLDGRVSLDRRPRAGDVVEVTVEALDGRGQGIAALHAAVGRDRVPRSYDVRVRKALPGERVTATVVQARRGELHARLDAILVPHPDRIAPRCGHFASDAGPGCGGCTFQGWPYARQAAAKEARVRELLGAVGVDDRRIQPIRSAPAPWHYRNKMEYSFGYGADGQLALGLYPAGNRFRVLSLTECYLQSPESAAVVRAVGERARALGLSAFVGVRRPGFLRTLTVREGKRTGERLLDLGTSSADTLATAEGELPARAVAEALIEAGVAAAGGEVTSRYWTVYHEARGERSRVLPQHLGGRSTVAEALHLPGGHRLRFEVHPHAFFQPNSFGAEVLYAEVLAAAGDIAGASVWDLYCGTGTIALCLSPYAARVTGVELVESAVDNARANAALNDVTNVTFFAGDVGRLLAAGSLGPPDVVIMDPPRAGLLPHALEHVTAASPARLVYVSCNPEALARDVAALEIAGYRLESAQPLDLFPQTGHVETVARLGR